MQTDDENARRVPKHQRVYYNHNCSHWILLKDPTP